MFSPSLLDSFNALIPLASVFHGNRPRIGSRTYAMPKITCVKDGKFILGLSSNITFSSTGWLAQATEEAFCQAKQKYSLVWRLTRILRRSADLFRECKDLKDFFCNFSYRLFTFYLKQYPINISFYFLICDVFRFEVLWKFPF